MDKRVKYWENNYITYWKDRLSECSESSLSKKDVLPPDLKIFKKYYQKALGYLNNGPVSILDVGIGFGRCIPMYIGCFKNNIWGSDISQSMIKECKKLFPKIAKQVVVAPAEKQPFENNSIDMLVCWATYDATYQEQALMEFQRLLKIGGVALITGKNDNYYKNDKKALIAEINARKKGHPNHFTDVKFLEQCIDDFGFEIIKVFKFRRRGDFAKDLNETNVHHKFYEYILILRKTKNINNRIAKHKIFSKFSKTFDLIDKLTNY